MDFRNIRREEILQAVVYLNEEPCSKEQNRHQDCGEEKPGASD